MNDVIYETVISTVAPDGTPHVAPMGIRYRPAATGSDVILMPFKPSTTLANILVSRHAVLNIVVDTRVFAGSVTGRRTWPVQPTERIAGVRLACALTHVELELAELQDDVQRPVLRMARVFEASHAPYIGFNRAQAAVIEGAVLVSRLHMLPAQKVEAEMRYLQIAIDKTAGPEEHEAWGWLTEAVARHRAAADPLNEETPPMMRMLVSVRDVTEARIADFGGADFIDLKEPRDGALGGLPIETIESIVRALREHGSELPISATIGDLPMHDLPAILARVEAVAACGVDYVKVGIEREPQARAVLDALAASGHAIVPVFIADRGLDVDQVAHACSLNFPGVMVDTADKRAGSLFDLVSVAELRLFVTQVRASGAMVGLAGALHHPQLEALRQLAPDFAGFRSAVCTGDRSGELDPERLRSLAAALHAAPVFASA